MSIAELKQMSLEQLIKVDSSKLTTEELAYLEKRLVQASNRRIKRLKETKKISLTKLSKKEKKGFTTYKPPKEYKPKTEVKGVYELKKAKRGKRKTINVRNKRIRNVKAMQDLLAKKTSTVKGVDTQLERYKNVIKSTLGNDINITDRQAKRISKLMEKAKEMGINTDANKKLSGSPRLLSLVVDIVKSKKYVKNDDAELIIQNAITEGYETAQKKLREFRKEDMDGLDVDSEEESEELDYDDIFNIF